jgi:predicted aspartyl protease
MLATTGILQNAYAALLNYRGQFHAEDLQGFSDNLHTYEMRRCAPTQVVAGATGFTVATRRDPLGNTDVPVTVGKTEMWWMFDTGANISTISLSTATRLGLTLSRGSATTQSGATATRFLCTRRSFRNSGSAVPSSATQLCW